MRSQYNRPYKPTYRNSPRSSISKRNQRKSIMSKFNVNHVNVLLFFAIAVSVLIILRLFYLQVWRFDFFQEAAAREHQGYTELPAKRGEILIQDYADGDLQVVASNTTMDLIYVDPKLITNKTLVASTLSDVLFDFDREREKDNQRIIEEKREFKRTGNMEAYDRVEQLSDEDLKNAFYHEILGKVSRDIRMEILLSNILTEDELNEIQEKNLQGIEVDGNRLLAYPKKILNRMQVARSLSEYVQIAPARLEQILAGENRYDIIMRKVDPEKSRQLREIIRKDKEQNPGAEIYLGVGLTEEYYRFYPEKTLAANILGFVDKESRGQYGIEESFDKDLRGKKWCV